LKNRNLILFILFIVTILLFLIPATSIAADPVNLVVNGDFSQGAGGLDGWTVTPGLGSVSGGQLVLNGTTGVQAMAGTTSPINLNDPDSSAIWNDPRITFRIEVAPKSPGFDFHLNLFCPQDNGYYIMWVYNLNTNYSVNVKEWLASYYPARKMSDFSQVYQIFLRANSGSSIFYVDNIFLGLGDPLSEPDEGKNDAADNTYQKEDIWVRNTEMTCKNVWINDSGDFQFSFIYPYADNNWVRIYDMAGKMVYEVDMPYDNPNIIVDLPNGMYTVKTFNVDPANPIQTFVIGKP
jgi:hypothetical protein